MPGPGDAAEKPAIKPLALALLLALPLAACAGVPHRPARPAPSSYGCMQAVVGRLSSDLPDKRAHCRAAGLIARYCSVPEAYLAGAGKELRDAVSGGDVEWTDWRADRAGIGCARHGTDEQSLFECCAERGY